MHEDREDELRCARMQATAVVREDLWKHRDDSSWCIYTCSAEICLSIESTSLAHIFTYISDVHTEQIASVVVSHDRYRIIEILRIGSIDRDRRPSSEVETLVCSYLHFRKE